MKKASVKFLSLWLALTVLLVGCADNTPETVDTSIPTSSLPIETAIGFNPQDFTWQPYVFSDLYREYYGEKMEQDFYKMVAAMMKGEDSFECPNEDTMYTLCMIAQDLFPPYAVLVSSDIYYEDGKAHLTYIVTDKQRKQILAKFDEKVTEIVKSAVKEGDTKAMAAIALYHTYSSMITYDEEAAADNVIKDVSCYRGLTEFEGICQSFGPAYAYLCLQCGIDAVTVGGMNETEAHEWTMINLNRENYYCDPTFEGGMGGNGLRYFGMTAEKRQYEGEYIAEEYTIGYINDLRGRDIDVTDDRFSALWDATNVLNIHRENGKMIIECEREDKSTFEFIVE